VDLLFGISIDNKTDTPLTHTVENTAPHIQEQDILMEIEK
jgi:hypothetical protein